MPEIPENLDEAADSGLRLTSCSPLRVRELSLRPYHGRLFVAPTTAAYERAHQRIFKTPDVLNCGQEGRFSGGEGNNGMWTYLVWAEKPHTLAHELSHVVLHVFERCKIDPREGNGEPFCYMLSQLILEANAGGMARELAAQDSDNSNDING